MSRKTLVLLIIFVLIGLWLWVLAYLLRTEHNGEFPPEKGMTYYAPTSAPVMPASSPARTVVPFKPVSSARTARVAATPTTVGAKPSPRNNTASNGWKLYLSSSATVHSIGGGGGGAAGSGAAGNSGSNRSGVTPSYGFSVNSGLFLATSSMPLMARNVEGGMTADQTLAMMSPRRVIINDDDDESGYGNDDLRPTDPSDPYFTPIGDTPWVMMGLLCLLFVAIRETLRAQRKVVN